MKCRQSVVSVRNQEEEGGQKLEQTNFEKLTMGAELSLRCPLLVLLDADASWDRVRQKHFTKKKKKFKNQSKHASKLTKTRAPVVEAEGE
jgi:hypothetical protein